MCRELVEQFGYWYAQPGTPIELFDNPVTGKVERLSDKDWKRAAKLVRERMPKYPEIHRVGGPERKDRDPVKGLKMLKEMYGGPGEPLGNVDFGPTFAKAKEWEKEKKRKAKFGISMDF